MSIIYPDKNADQQPLDPRQGYDLIAPYYEEWRWFKFWRLNEAPLIRQWLESLPRGLGLDAGSGTGPYIPDIIELGHRCVAVDLSHQMLRINKQGRAAQTNAAAAVSHVQADVSTLPFNESQFDWILCSRVLSHLPSQMIVLQEFARVLKSGGECLISDVHPEHPYKHVSIPAWNGEIAIETHKHSLGSLKTVVSDIRDLQIVSLNEYYFRNLLSKPSRAEFEKLYRYSDAAVFYICRLKKL
jgi:ubiquinone/menaquinone biosynthesis C-methylase UbiE